MNNNLFNNITNGDIKGSIYNATILILGNDKDAIILEDTIVNICNHIGSFISLIDIKLWIDVINDTIEFIKNENICLKEIYLLITKLCIIYNIYLKNPISKTGLTNIKVLRERVITIFENSNVKISDIGIDKFETIIPPIGSDTYNLSLQIICGLIGIIKDTECLDDENTIIANANKMRDAFDYIIRKHFLFETKTYVNDSDCVWFLWGLISIIHNDEQLQNVYNLFKYKYSKKQKNNRVGFLWGIAVYIIYLCKKNISRDWNKKEIAIIKKIDDVANDLFKEIKQELIAKDIIENDIDECKSTCETSGLDYICNFIPVVNNNISDKNNNIAYNDDVRKIRYK